MPTKEFKNQIDAQWRALQPNWDQKQYNNELKLLYDNLINNENIQVLIGCTWGPADSFNDDASTMAKLSRFDGIAVATDSRVLFLKKRGFSKMVSSMPLQGIEIEEQAGVGEVIVTGPCITNWLGGGSSLTGAVSTTYLMRGLQGNEVGQFTGYLRGGRGGAVSPMASEPPVAFTSEPATTEHPDKSSRIDAQWRDRLLFKGGNKFDGEREKLHTILDDDENIEVLLGGRWEKEGYIGRVVGWFGKNPEKGNDGVVVATDRRVLFLDKSFVSDKVVEMPYDDIEGVSSNIGVRSDGLIIASRAIDNHEFHFDHENSLNYKGLTGVFADRVRGLIAALDAPPASRPPDADE